MFYQSFELRTDKRDDMVDITPQVAKAARDSGISDGVVTVFVPHTTAAVTINENADPDVVHDVLASLDAAIPRHQPFYRHGEGNSAAHTKSSLIGSSRQILLRGGKLLLGTWQAVYFCEFDGPRTRQFHVTAS